MCMTNEDGGDHVGTGNGGTYSANLHVVLLSCFDRIIIVGTLPGACYAQGMASILYQQGVRIFDYPRFAEPLRERIRARAHEVCAEAGIEIEHVGKSHIRKEEFGGACAGDPRRCSPVWSMSSQPWKPAQLRAMA